MFPYNCLGFVNTPDIPRLLIVMEDELTKLIHLTCSIKVFLHVIWKHSGTHAIFCYSIGHNCSSLLQDICPDSFLGGFERTLGLNFHRYHINLVFQIVGVHHWALFFTYFKANFIYLTHISQVALNKASLLLTIIKQIKHPCS